MNLQGLKKHNGKYVIYFLYLDGELQYIGQTKNLLRRVQAHAQTKAFDEIGVACHDGKARKFDNEERQQYMDYVETVEILNRKPKLNKRQSNEDAYIDFVYGLSENVKKYIWANIPSLQSV